MSNLLVNMRDQQFVLFEQIGIDKLFDGKEFNSFSKEDALMILKEAEKMAVNVILPTLAEGDRQGCTLTNGSVSIPSCYHQAYKKYVEGGWLCPSKSSYVGGQGLPESVTTAALELIGSANFALVLYPTLNIGAAGLIEEFGTSEQKHKYMYPMYSGKWAGTMCLTEPGAGSDVGALKTTARRLPDGTFSITGTKCFISGGDHDLNENIIHPVLARIEGDPSGTKGISIFIVPKYRVNNDGTLGEFNDIRTGNIEHKMGIKGSATATLNFGEDGKCVGELLGNEREGMKIMFKMMNESRLNTGMQGLMNASAAYEHAVQYACERIQGASILEGRNPEAKPVTIIHHPDVRRKLLWMKAHVEGIRVLNYFVAHCMDKARIASSDEEKKDWNGLVDLLTPVCKAYSSDKGVLVCSAAMDIYGGYGYCSDYPIEQYFRDVKITTIYEGANGIQSFGLIARQLGQRKGKNILNLLNMMNDEIPKLQNNIHLKQYSTYLEESVVALSDLVNHFSQINGDRALVPILNATPYLEIMGDVLIGLFLLQGARIADQKLEAFFSDAGVDTADAKEALVNSNRDAVFYIGKVSAAKYFAVNVLTTVKSRSIAIKLGEMSPMEIPEEAFAF